MAADWGVLISGQHLPPDNVSGWNVGKTQSAAGGSYLGRNLRNSRSFFGEPEGRGGIVRGSESSTELGTQCARVIARPSIRGPGYSSECGWGMA